MYDIFKNAADGRMDERDTETSQVSADPELGDTDTDVWQPMFKTRCSGSGAMWRTMRN